MGTKKIVDLQIRDAVTDDLNFPSDDGIASYRVTGEQIKNFVLDDDNIPTTALQDEAVTRDKIDDIERIPTGTILPFAGDVSTPPAGFVSCDGSLISKTTYAALYAVLGTIWGAGDASNFQLPDSRGIFLKGAGTTNRTLGKDASGNYYAATLGAYVTDKMQGHYHSYYYEAAGSANKHCLGASATSQLISGGGASDGVNAAAQDGTNGTPRTGHTTEPQHMGVNFIIKY